MGLSHNARMTNGNHSFALAYGMDVVIPTEMGMPTHPGLSFKARETNIQNLKDTWIEQMKQEEMHPFGWRTTNNEVFPTTIRKSDNVPSRLEF